MGVVTAVNAAVRFVLELCALAALGYWGFRTGSGPVVRIILAAGAPLLAGAAWALFGAPARPASCTACGIWGWKC